MQLNVISEKSSHLLLSTNLVNTVCFEQHGLVKGAPARGRGLELDDLHVLSNPNHSVVI